MADAGCSAGLNLLIDRYRFDYGPAGSVGQADSPVTVAWLSVDAPGVHAHGAWPEWAS